MRATVLLLFALCSIVLSSCGDGNRELGVEGCDDGNLISGDGCSASCTVEDGYFCTIGPLSNCSGICGDGLRLPSEVCDDGDTEELEDGCSHTIDGVCVQTPGWTCHDVVGAHPIYNRSECVIDCPKCNEGKFLISPCLPGQPTRCVDCSPCPATQIVFRNCTNSADTVCQCDLANGFYGPDCALSCHTQCAKTGGKCSISVPENRWWCECPPGTAPNDESRQCLTNKQLSDCAWQPWNAWSSCGLCGTLRTRSRSPGPGAPVICPSSLIANGICSTNCSGLSYDAEKNITSKYDEGSEGYGSLSLYAFWSTEGDKLMKAKYYLKVGLSDDPEKDAYSGVFRLSFSTWNGPIPTLKRGLNRTGCNTRDPLLAEAYEEFKNITLTFLVQNRGFSKEHIDVDLEECVATTTIVTPTDKSWVAAAVIAPVSFFFLLLAFLLFLWRYYKPLNLSSLPDPVRYSFQKCLDNSQDWGSQGEGSTLFHYKKIAPQGDEWEKLCKIFYGFQEAEEALPVEAAYAVYNPLLTANFVNTLQVTRARFAHNPELHNTKPWMLEGTESEIAQRTIVYDAYKERAKSWLRHAYPSGAVPELDNDIVILPVVHGTDFNIARTICMTGFASLSLLDSGWYGKGIYFSSFAMYTAPYFTNRREPAIIISFVITGNPYPVVENTDLPAGANLIGAALKSGFNSHFVIVNPDGTLPDFANVSKNDLMTSSSSSSSTTTTKKTKLRSIYDEIVIPQESQIVPAYVLKLDMAQTGKFSRRGEGLERKKKEPAKKRMKTLDEV